MTDVDSLSEEEVHARLWERGQLRWILDTNQQGMYDQYRAWEALDPHVQPGHHPLIFVCECGKRVGKSTLFFLIKVEDCLRNPGSNHRYASAYAKNIDDIVSNVAGAVLDSCPEELRPKYLGASANKPARYVFPNGSELRLVGLDQNPDGLRGRASDGDVISEAAFVRHLRYTVQNVIVHQYQGRRHARLILETSAPVDADTDYDLYYVADSKERPLAYLERTLYDNPRLTQAEKDLFIREAGGVDNPECQREYFNKRVRNPVGTVVPEFDRDRHVVDQCVVPPYAHCYVGIDPGMTDLCGIVMGYWDFERAKLVIQRSWAASNANTTAIADWIKSQERLFWLGNDNPEQALQFWNGRQFKQNPYLRVSDTDARLIGDLNTEHALRVVPTAKDNLEAQVHSLRNAFLRGQIEIWKGSGPLADHCNAATWNRNRTTWERHPIYSHFDCLSALMYLWRNVIRNLNPFPPEHLGKDSQTHHVTKGMVRHVSKEAKVLEKALIGGNGRFRQRFAPRRFH